VAPVVAALAHESCPLSGETFSAGGGRVAHVFLGETSGIFDPALTPETVAASWEAIRDAGKYTTPPDQAVRRSENRERLRAEGV